MNENRSSVINVIMNYVDTCGGDITLLELAEDYRTSFNNDIPFRKFGHENLLDFMRSISGLKVLMVDGKYRVQTRFTKKSNSTNSLSPDMSFLCVTMKNNLIIPSNDVKREVTVKNTNAIRYSPQKPNLSRSCSQFSIKSDERYERSPSYWSRDNSTCSSNDNSDFSHLTNTDFMKSVPENYQSYEYNSPSSYIPLTSILDSSLEFQKERSHNDWNFSNTAQESYSSHGVSNDVYPSNNSQQSSMYNCLLDQRTRASPLSVKQIVNRLVSLVNAHQEKSTSSAIEYNYYDSYSDTLPKNWLTLLKESNLLYIEHLASAIMIYPNRLSNESPTLSSLPDLEFPDIIPWSVKVISIQSTNSVWFRLKENELDRRYLILSQELHKHYSEVTEGNVAVASIRIGNLYVIKQKETIRVCVLGIEDEFVKCLAIDEGFVDKFRLNKLMRIHEKFTNVPKLALVGSLVNLSKYAECRHIKQKLEKIVSGGGEASVIFDESNGEKFLMNLFVAKNDNSINVNEYLLNVIKKELDLPTFCVNEMHDVFVLNLGEHTARVHVMSPCYELLQETLQKSRYIIDCTDKRLLFAKSLMDVQPNHMYLAQYKDYSFQRIVVKQYIDSSHVAVVFIDFQEVQALDVASIICYTEFPDTLTFIPPQAINVEVVKTDHAIMKFMAPKLRTNMFSMKIIETNPKLYVQIYLKVPDVNDEERARKTLGSFGIAV